VPDNRDPVLNHHPPQILQRTPIDFSFPARAAPQGQAQEKGQGQPPRPPGAAGSNNNNNDIGIAIGIGKIEVDPETGDVLVNGQEGDDGKILGGNSGDRMDTKTRQRCPGAGASGDDNADYTLARHHQKRIFLVVLDVN
jgi:hypothetical protein